MLTNWSQSGHYLMGNSDLERKLESHILIKGILDKALEDCPPCACRRPHPRWESPQTYMKQQQVVRQQAFHSQVTRGKESLVWSVVNPAILKEASTKQGLWRVENNKT